MKIEDFTPIAQDVKAGHSYRWCGCGCTTTKPFCDKEGCGDKCVVYHATQNETVYFCNCKQTKDPPLCDGSHAKLLIAAMQDKKK